MTAEPDPRVTALGCDVERATRRVAAAEERTRQLDTLIRQLAEDIAVLTPTDHSAEVDAAPVRSWLAAADTTQARADLADLADWIAAVYRRYPGGSLRSCWLWHPAVVEELWWLRNAHHAAYHGRGACWRDVGDWHDRQRPGATTRINKALSVCELSQHLDTADRHTPAVPLAQHAEQIAEHWTTHRSTPEPTDQQLTEADHHDRTEDRRHTR